MKTETSLHRQLGLTDAEYQRIEQLLGRSPNRAELAMYSVMWSEHCSYKSSRLHLRSLPADSPHVILGPGEGAGVVEVDGVAVALRIESHNHPSYIEPVQGAATGIGGIVRDVLSVGARPIALLDPLRFGPLPVEGRVDEATGSRNRYLVEGVVSGISSYGNCIGVPTVGGEVCFEDSYSGNPLVNVMCIGVGPIERVMRASAHGVGNAVVLVGSKTGRDGIGGVSILASAAFEEGDEDKRPSVQVGDPFTEKLLIEACLELMEKGLAVGVQDLGGAGLCCGTSETAARAGTGMKIDLARVPRRETGMEPFEVLISESQERMLLVIEQAGVPEVLSICGKWGLSATVIGEVTDTGRLEVFEDGEPVADVPAASLGDGPVYDRPMRRPVWIDALAGAEIPLDPPPDLSVAILRVLGSPNIASKQWVYEQYDHQVMLGTVVKPGHDAAVLRIRGARSKIAVTCEGNGRYCAIDPYLGVQHALAQAVRNLAVVGARPLALTDCLNFGNPEKEEVMWQFAEAVRGLGDSCRALSIPVVGGNVSFYNETAGRPIDPTPIVGLLGVVKDGVHPPPMGFQRAGDLVVLVGVTKIELGGSEYSRTVVGEAGGQLPSLDLGNEAAVARTVVTALEQAVISSAHDCSEGGLAVALAEACIKSADGLGAEVEAEAGLDLHLWLFSETASRILVSVEPEKLDRLRSLAAGEGVTLSVLGTVGGTELRCSARETSFVLPVARLRAEYEEAFAGAMGYGNERVP